MYDNIGILHVFVNTYLCILIVYQCNIIVYQIIMFLTYKLSFPSKVLKK